MWRQAMSSSHAITPDAIVDQMKIAHNEIIDDAICKFLQTRDKTQLSTALAEHDQLLHGDLDDPDLQRAMSICLAAKRPAPTEQPTVDGSTDAAPDPKRQKPNNKVNSSESDPIDALDYTPSVGQERESCCLLTRQTACFIVASVLASFNKDIKRIFSSSEYRKKIYDVLLTTELPTVEDLNATLPIWFCFVRTKTPEFRFALPASLHEKIFSDPNTPEKLDLVELLQVAIICIHSQGQCQGPDSFANLLKFMLRIRK